MNNTDANKILANIQSLREGIKDRNQAIDSISYFIRKPCQFPNLTWHRKTGENSMSLEICEEVDQYGNRLYRTDFQFLMSDFVSVMKNDNDLFMRFLYQLRGLKISQIANSERKIEEHKDSITNLIKPL